MIEEMKNYLSYNPDTGEITRTKTICNRALAGTVVGCNQSGGYLCFRFNGKLYLCHRVAWALYYGEWPLFIDHMNKNKKDNRISNLRNVTKAQNGQNKKLVVTNTSGVMGVSYMKDRDGWRARINLNKQNKYLGCYKDWFDAVCARKTAERKYGFHPNHGAIE